MNDIRSSLGFCPQYVLFFNFYKNKIQLYNIKDILYDDLTVAEHIDLIASVSFHVKNESFLFKNFFLQIKGYSRKEIKEEIIQISKLVGLENDLEKKSKQLSGGMKRRLSVAIALTGGSKVIILDEPTSGLGKKKKYVILA